MLDSYALEEITLHPWNSQDLNISLKHLHGKPYIDIRKWAKGMDGILSPRKGMMMDIQAWKLVIPALNKMILEHDDSKA